MARFALSRIVQAIPTMVIVSMLVFGLIRMAPGDPAAMRMGREAAKPENLPKLEALREQMGLTKPIPAQYLDWITRECKARGIARMFLESGHDNHRAHDFFERAGFAPVSVVMMKDIE